MEEVSLTLTLNISEIPPASICQCIIFLITLTPVTTPSSVLPGVQPLSREFPPHVSLVKNCNKYFRRYNYCEFHQYLRSLINIYLLK